MNAETWQRIHLLADEWFSKRKDAKVFECLRYACPKTVDCLRPEGHDGECWPTEVDH